MARDSIKSSIINWWRGGEAVKEYGTIAIFRVPQSLPQRLGSRFARWANRPYGVALIAGIAVVAITKFLGLT